MKKIHPLICLIFSTFLSTIVFGQVDTTEQVAKERVNSAEAASKPYVILISADGFRYDYAIRYNATELLKRGKSGVVAQSMIPSFPSVTFPNHYTIATGLYPSHHGIVDNSFYDESFNARYSMSNSKNVIESRWYGGMPIWALAEKQNMLTASYYWVGTEAALGGIFPSRYFKFNNIIPMDRRLEQVRNWMKLPESVRPHLIALYFPEVDHEGHLHGPESKETGEAVHMIDRAVAVLARTADSLKLPVNFIFLADHGMAMTDTVNTIPFPAILKDTSLCRYTASANLIHVYVKKRDNIQMVFEKLRPVGDEYAAYLTDDTPQAWHYRKKDDRYNRLGDIILTTKLPRIFNYGKYKDSPGKHGFGSG